MKRLLALLLALLLPGCAAAESYELSVSIEVNEESFASFAMPTVQGDPALSNVDARTLIAEVVECLNGMSTQLIFKEDAWQAKVNLGTGELLDAAVYTQDERAFLTSSMMPGYALYDALESEASVPAVDSDAVCAGMESALSAWLGNLEPTVSYGTFDGDAYEGGAKCTTYSITDMDVAALVSALATEELRVLAAEFLTALGLDDAALLTQFDALNARVADEDAGLYILRIVTDEADAFVGASLTVVHGQAQVATLSLGAAENRIRLVVGLGLRAQNYWWELDCSFNNLQSSTYISGNAREWVADKAESFSYVRQTNAPLADYALRLNLSKAGSRYLWVGNISVSGIEYNEELCAVSGSCNVGTKELDCTISLGAEQSAPLALKVRFGPADAIPPMDETLQLCSLSAPEDVEKCQELLEKFAARIMARLIKLLPMDIIMTLNEYELPQ